MKRLISVVVVLMMTGCAHLHPPTQNTESVTQDNGLAEISLELKNIAERAQRSLAELSDANIVNAKANGVNLTNDVRQAKVVLPDSLPVEFQAQVSFDYDGELKGLLQRIAILVDYDLEVTGSKRHHEIVTVHTQKQSLAAALRSAYSQTSLATGVRVYPDSRAIILDYGDESHA